jgi:hypothetical protein
MVSLKFAELYKYEDILPIGLQTNVEILKHVPSVFFCQTYVLQSLTVKR